MRIRGHRKSRSSEKNEHRLFKMTKKAVLIRNSKQLPHLTFFPNATNALQLLQPATPSLPKQPKTWLKPKCTSVPNPNQHSNQTKPHLVFPTHRATGWPGACPKPLVATKQQC